MCLEKRMDSRPGILGGRYDTSNASREQVPSGSNENLSHAYLGKSMH